MCSSEAPLSSERVRCAKMCKTPPSDARARGGRAAAFPLHTTKLLFARLFSLSFSLPKIGGSFTSRGVCRGFGLFLGASATKETIDWSQQVHRRAARV